MYTEDFEDVAKQNTNFRKVLQTGKYSQLVVMSIPIGEDIGEEVHPDTDQMFFIVEGDAEAVLNGERKTIEDESVFFVPAGATHNLKNTGDEDLKLITVYAPPQHPDGTVHATKKDAQRAEV